MRDLEKIRGGCFGVKWYKTETRHTVLVIISLFGATDFASDS